MTKEQIIAMAREADIGPVTISALEFKTGSLSRFAALVAAAEREACAVVAEGLVMKQHKHVNGGRTFFDHMHWEDIALAIRARGDNA